ncbi:MAG: phosphatidate cytidylyltransferase [Polyangiaceae bacterium]|nr:phosphatidate cytidylyltransferase [Polyangiaceae bacterium]
MAASNLTLRLVTAGIALPGVLVLLFLGPPWGWFLFMLFVAVVSAHELIAMTHGGDWPARIVGILMTWAVVSALFWREELGDRALVSVLLATPMLAILLTLARLGEMRTAALRLCGAAFGPLYLGAGIGAVALLRRQPGLEGSSFVLFSLAMAWLSDTGAYFAGRLLGKRKLYEAVSPKKTIEGAVGGVAAAVGGAALGHFTLLPDVPLWQLLVVGGIASALGQMGDLGESLLKRSVGVKDSGGFFPGHGGMLDRIDAVLLTAPTTLLYVLWFRP